MRTTVDIPDAIYAELKARAAKEGRPVKELVLRGVEFVLNPERATRKKKKLKLPLIESKEPGWFNPTNEMIDEFMWD